MYLSLFLDFTETLFTINPLSGSQKIMSAHHNVSKELLCHFNLLKERSLPGLRITE